MFLISFILFFIISSAKANEFQSISIYADISEVYASDGSKGTSTQLNTLVSHYAQSASLLEDAMHKHAAPEIWNGNIAIYDWTNIQYMPGFKKCDYLNSVKCGIKNNHWTLKTIVSVGDKYTVLTQKIYDQNGIIISHATQTAWGKIRWKPRWKLTKIKEQGPFGGGSKEIFEMWPPKMEELPPLVKPIHIHQMRFGVYSVKKSACTVESCK